MVVSPGEYGTRPTKPLADGSPVRGPLHGVPPGRMFEGYFRSVKPAAERLCGGRHEAFTEPKEVVEVFRVGQPVKLDQATLPGNREEARLSSEDVETSALGFGGSY